MYLGVRIKPKKVYEGKLIEVDNYQQRVEREKEREMAMQPCSHQLVVKKLEERSSNFSCSCCRRFIIEDHPILECIQCNIFLDESCSKLPHEIQHPLHPSHFLTLIIKPLRQIPMDRKRCYACGECLFKSFYGCLQCDFKLCLGCDSLIPTTTNIDKTNQLIQKQVITHPHPLIQCYRSEYFCYGCFLHLEDGGKNSISIYVCLDCQMLLCKSCVCLPHEVEHPFHSAHPLSLAGHNILRTISGSGATNPECAVCLQPIYHRGRGLFYECRKCIFNLHIRCASLMPHLINSQIHPQHPLALLDVEVYNVRCGACKLICQHDYPFFSCTECRFIFHVHCLPDLPTRLKHKCHLHPLTLTHSPIKDYEGEGDDSEFLCDACEKHRRLNDPTYYCVECHYVAHVHCVISEILPHLQRESSLGVLECDVGGEDQVEVLVETACLGDGTKDDHDQVLTTADDFSVVLTTEELKNICIVGDSVVDELDIEMLALQTEVDRSKAQVEVLKRQLETEITQLATHTIKLDQLKERRAQHILSLQQ